jgi:NTP pyrophosphatase (non-canonical NTP hydrolase)
MAYRRIAAHRGLAIWGRQRRYQLFRVRIVETFFYKMQDEPFQVWQSGYRSGSMDTLTLDSFALQITKTDKRPPSDALRIAVLGVFGELGSLMSEIKKEAREGPSYVSFRDTLTEEAGDLLWYFGALASTIARPMSELYSRALETSFDGESSFSQIEERLPLLTHESGDPWLHAGERAGSLAAHVANNGNDESLFGIAVDALRAVLVAFQAAGISLAEAASNNVSKSRSRFPVSKRSLPLYDDRPYVDGSRISDDERIPLILPFEFNEIEIRGKKFVVQKVFTIKIGDPLTDNIDDSDDYRFHDVFHMAYAAVLGWSPVLRALLKVKRKSHPSLDENQDGARAILIEEGISTFVFNHAQPHLFAGATGVDYRLLSMIKEFVRGYEVADQPLWAWERAILRGFDVFRQLKTERRGRVIMDLTQRDVTFERLGA